MTKKDENNTSEKEIYRLWWEYLKRSESYKEYCDIEPRIRIIKKIGKDKKFRLYVKLPHRKKITSWVVSQEECLIIWNLERNWDAFGNIFKTSFDDWWKKRKIPNKELPVLALNDADICKMLPSFMEHYKKLKMLGVKYLSPKELIKQLTETENNYIFLAIPMVGNVTIEEISKQIASIRMEYKKQPLYRLADYNFKRFIRPISRVRFDEMKRYLRVYDLKKSGLKIKEIIEEIDPDRKGFDADIVRSFRSDLQKARKLIANVQNGFFPEEPTIVTQEYLMSLKQQQLAKRKKID